MRFLSICFFILCYYNSGAQSAQVSIDRVDLMPDAPTPYDMRDWKQVTLQYDALIFDQTLTGLHLPLLTLKSSGRNYPQLKPIQLDSYVGSNTAGQAEAINIIPAIVGASLVGVDKSNQSGVNWVDKVKDFYNSANGQNVYLNGTNSSSGNDWWYDAMPNVFFYQLYSLYPDTPDFAQQFTMVADRWLEAVHAMGGKSTPWTIPSMNYRGWRLASMTGNSEGVKEPEAAGSIAWLLYQAYRATGDKKYLGGAQMCLDFLSALDSNPSYELQLPYGIITAAQLNATLGAAYDVDKMLNWTFNKGELRNWGTIVGTWNGMDVSGVIGEANDSGNDYAFLMNGFQHAAALAPLAKYDKRFARAIAKWILNLSNASRLFYPAFLPSDKQDDFQWSSQYDPNSVIAYEALKENLDGKLLYGTGDAKRNDWAETNLGLYGSSHVGYLAAVVSETNAEMILELDLNKTDFFADNTYRTSLLFNPHQTNTQVTLSHDVGPYDVYDAISETMIAQNVGGDISVSIHGNEVLLLTFLPAGTVTSVKDKKLYAGGHVVDYHYTYDFAPRFRIKSLTADKEAVELNDVVNVYATVENATTTPTYQWFVDDVLQTENTAQLEFTEPAMTGQKEIKVEVTADGVTVKDSIVVSVLSTVPTTPILTGMTSDQLFYLPGATANIVAHVQNAETEKFTYEWIVPSGNFVQDDSLITWVTPAEGVYLVRCVVKNSLDLTTEGMLDVLVKGESTETTQVLAYYPLNNDVKDYSGNEFDGHVEGTSQANDALGVSNFAYLFSSGSDVIFVNNNSGLNFRDAITLSFWISPGVVGHEAFLLSHGSWEERWKVSITPDKKIRWTVKTDAGVKDLDSAEPVASDQFIHIAAVYTGYSMELYIDGELDGFIPHDGLMLTTAKQITFGQKSYDDRQFYYNGILDEVRIYDRALQPNEISSLRNLWHEEVPLAASRPHEKSVRVYPNPSWNGAFAIDSIEGRIIEISLYSTDGKELPLKISDVNGSAIVQTEHAHRGFFLLKIITTREVSYVRLVIP